VKLRSAQRSHRAFRQRVGATGLWAKNPDWSTVLETVRVAALAAVAPARTAMAPAAAAVVKRRLNSAWCLLQGDYPARA